MDAVAAEQLTRIPVDLPVYVSAVLAVLTVVIAVPKSSRRGFRESLAADATYSFSDSWASSVTAIGALLATVLAATDVLKAAIPKVSLIEPLGLDLLFAALTVVAGLAVLAFGKSDSGAITISVGSFIIGALLTLWGAFGQLVTLLWMVEASDADTSDAVPLYTLVALAMFVLATYGVRTVKAQVTPVAGEDVGDLPARPMGGGAPGVAPAPRWRKAALL